MDEDRLFSYLAGGIEIILTGDINPISKDLNTKGITNKNCINIYYDAVDDKLIYINHRINALFKYMNGATFMGDRKYILINLLTKDRLKLQAMMSLGFSFEDSLYELYIKDKEPVLHSYN